jgi:hypothetical protein
MTVSSVGRLTIKDTMCRWIEIKVVQKTGSGVERTDVFKLLIPEKHFFDGSNPLDHMVRAWSRRGQMPSNEPATIRLDNTAVDRVPLNPLFFGTPPDAKSIESAPVTSVLGELPCAGASGSHSVAVGTKGDRVVYTYERRVHPKSPFGIVSYHIESERIQGATSSGRKSISNYTLVAFGEGARSELPDAK